MSKPVVFHIRFQIYWHDVIQSMPINVVCSVGEVSITGTCNIYISRADTGRLFYLIPLHSLLCLFRFCKMIPIKPQGTPGCECNTMEYSDISMEGWRVEWIPNGQWGVNINEWTCVTVGKINLTNEIPVAHLLDFEAVPIDFLPMRGVWVFVSWKCVR